MDVSVNQRTIFMLCMFMRSWYTSGKYRLGLYSCCFSDQVIMIMTLCVPLQLFLQTRSWNERDLYKIEVVFIVVHMLTTQILLEIRPLCWKKQDTQRRHWKS